MMLGIIVASVMYLSWLNHISASDEISVHSRHNRDKIEEPEIHMSPSKHYNIRTYNQNTKNSKERRNGLTGRFLKSKGGKKASSKTKGKKKDNHAKKEENGSNGGYGNSVEISTIIPSNVPHENENDKKNDWGYGKENKNSSRSNVPTISPFDNAIEKNDNEQYGSSKNSNNDVPTSSSTKDYNENNNTGYGNGNAEGSIDVTGSGESEDQDNGSSRYDGHETEEDADKDESYQGNNIFGEQENSNTNDQALSIRASSAIYFVITASIVAFVLAVVIGAIRSVLTPAGNSHEREKSLLKLASGNDDINRAHCFPSKHTRDKEIQTDFVRV